MTSTGDADFGGVTFTGYAHFVEATFTGDAYFREAIFTGDAVFRAKLGGAYFSGATFEQARELGPLLAYTGLVLDDVQFK